MGIWSRRIKLGGLILVVFLSVLAAIGLVLGNKPGPSMPETTETAVPQTPQQAFVPDPRSEAISKLMLLEDFQGYLEGKKVAGDWSTVQPIDQRITAAQLHADYTANEVASDELFKGKSLAVTGIVVRTAKDAFGAPYVSLASGNMFEDVEADLADETIAKADTLIPGQRLEFVCTGDGLVVTSVRLKDCQTESVLLALRKPAIDGIVDQVLHGQGDGIPDKLKFVIGYIYAMGTALPANTPCDTKSMADVRACNRAYKAIPKATLAVLYDKLAKQINLPARPIR